MFITKTATNQAETETVYINNTDKTDKPLASILAKL